VKKNKLINIIIFLSVLSVLISVYLIYLHYSANASSFCNISEQLNCDVVNKSVYSKFPTGNGMPVSILGLLTFVTIFTIALLMRINKIKRKILEEGLFYLLVISFIFALYLFYVEAFILHSYCIFCLALDFLIILMLLISYNIKKTI